MLFRSTIQLLRFHFSIFLLPVFLFALSQVHIIHWENALLLFIILHILVYPSSNGYNSYMDRDEGPIGGLANPLQPTKQLFYVSVVMDAIAIGLALLISIYTATGILLYILASRAYSYRGIRLKKYPLWGYLVVIIFQGALIFFITYHGCSRVEPGKVPLIPLLASSALIGGYYPLTQVYQHEADRKDGVQTISMLFGVKGTFLFCGIIFAIATLLMFLTFRESVNHFFIFLVCMSPMLLFFTWWAMRVWKDERKADFISSFRMNILASLCTSVFFGILLLMN
jgi:1,4-dihydroxy-2-naphthoate polyprenyltransferase